MIEVQNLMKWYGPNLAVDNLSFAIPAGQIVGFLGPNGAGKTTTIRMLTGYLPPTSGRATIAGFDVTGASEQARAKIGYLPENTPLYPEMRVEEYLHYRGKLLELDRDHRKQRVDLVCDRCGLTKVRRRLIGQLSKGNRQRVGLAQALLHDPPVLILDEPTIGLDPNQIGVFRKLIAELRGQHTILLSTHILPEVEKTADRVMIISRGRIVADDTPDKLRESVAHVSGLLVEVKATAEAVANLFKKASGVRSVETATKDGWCRALVTHEEGKDVREALGQAMAANGWPVREMRYERATLEEYFVQITAEQAQTQATEQPVAVGAA